jgi:hypothetical protein
MKKHEWHALSMGILGFVLLLSYQNCGKPTVSAIENESDTVTAFMAVECVAYIPTQTSNAQTILQFNDEALESFEIYFNDVDCDQNVDALLVDKQNSQESYICYDYQNKNFLNCFRE